MDSIKSTKIVKKKNNSAQLLSLLVFISVLPLYGLYLHSPTTNPQSVTYNNFQQDFETSIFLHPEIRITVIKIKINLHSFMKNLHLLISD